MPYIDPRTNWTPDNAIGVTDLNRIEGNIQALKTIERAKGTPTSIVLSIGTLIDGYIVDFIANANNNAQATTINGVPLHPPGTAAFPRLLAGRAYTAWYSGGDNCFFITASATGTALASNVLNGVTFTNDLDVEVTGTLPTRKADISDKIYSTENVVGAHSGDGRNYAYMRIPNNTYLDGVNWVRSIEPQLLAENIIAGKTIFNVRGTRPPQALIITKVPLHQPDKSFIFKKSNTEDLANRVPYITLKPGFTPKGYLMLAPFGKSMIAINWTYEVPEFAFMHDSSLGDIDINVIKYYTDRGDYRCNSTELVIPMVKDLTGEVFVHVW